MTERGPSHRDPPNLWGPDIPRDVDDELAGHLEEREAEYRRQGLAPGEARRRALERFGDLAGVHATLVGIDESRARRKRMREHLEDRWRDVRLAARSFRRSPGYAVAAILTLALGIGATTAIFSIVNAVLLRPLPYRNPDRLVVAVGVRNGPRGNVRDSVAWPDYLDWREAAGLFESGAAIQRRGFVVDGSSGPELLSGGRVTASFFGTLGVTPVLGRDLTTADDTAGATPVVIISHHLWVAWFGGASDILDRTIEFEEGQRRLTRRIVGVLPESFESAFHLPQRADLWVPMAVGPDDPDDLARLTTRDVRWLMFVARLAPGVTLDEARARVEALSTAAYAERSDAVLRAGYTLIPLDERVVGSVRLALLLLLGAVGVLLLITCGNVSSLVFTRATAARHDLAIRAAIGAGRSQLVSQLLVESLVLAALGGAVGLLWVTWIRGALLSLAPEDIPRLAETSIDWQVLLFAVGVSIATAVTFGTLPAVRASRLELVEGLKPGSAGATTAHTRARGLLVAAEVALTFVLLAGAALLMASVDRLLRVNPGFDPAGVLAVSVSAPVDAVDAGRRAAFFGEVAARAAALPGATAAAVVNYLPLTPGFSNRDFTVKELVHGATVAPADERITVEVRRVSPDYFRVMRIPIRRGRAFMDSDAAGAPIVAIVSERLARHLWGDMDPIGRRLAVGFKEQPGVPVVGVVGDIHHFGLEHAPSLMIYLPVGQRPPFAATFVVRTSGDPLALAPALREAIRSIEPRALVGDVQTLDEVRSATVARPRFYAFLSGSFAALASLLSAVGLFGLVAHLVLQRRQELGVRLALGARPGQLLVAVLQQGLRAVTAGLALGLFAALAVTRVLRSLLFELSPTNPWVIGGVTFFLLVVALVACYVPARRVLRVDPVVALRSE